MLYVSSHGCQEEVAADILLHTDTDTLITPISDISPSVPLRRIHRYCHFLYGIDCNV